jgi:hypothetical protein
MRGENLSVHSLWATEPAPTVPRIRRREAFLPKNQPKVAKLAAKKPHPGTAKPQHVLGAGIAVDFNDNRIN